LGLKVVYDPVRLRHRDGLAHTVLNRTLEPSGAEASPGYGLSMRIAHVVPRGEQAASGVLTVIVELAAATARRGHEVDLWRLHSWNDSSYRTAVERLHAAGVALYDEAAAVSARLVGGSVAAGISRTGAHVTHIHGAYNVWNTRVTRSLTTPYVFSPHSGYDPVSLRRSRLRKLLYSAVFERPMLRKASICIGLTETEAENLRAQGAKGDVPIIPNGVTPALANTDRTALRRELGLDPETPVALFVGRLDVYRKGLDALLKGLAEAPAWHLVLVGPDFRDGVRRIQELVGNLSLAGRVQLLGARHGETLEDAYAGADLFVLPSRWEGLSMALLEGMAHGLPVLVSRTVDTALGIAAAGAGWSAAHDDLGRVLSSLSQMDQATWSKVRRAAREFAGRFKWDDIAARYERVYASAAHGQRTGQ
jgi:glycosyltransferase involved in cell wall biosynthesis